MIEPVIIGNATLYCGDCMDILPMLDKVDAVITDPPYGINADKAAAKNQGKWGWKFHEFLGWDSATPSSAIFQAIKDAAPIHVIWGGNYFPEILDAHKGWLVWDKAQTGLTMSDGELAYTNMDRPLRILQLHRTHLWQEKPEHPTQKPLALMRWCIDQVPGCKSVLDPFMGSGSTGVACMQAGRSFIGIEREPKYFDIACERISRAQAQGTLLPPEEPRQPVQEGLL